MSVALAEAGPAQSLATGPAVVLLGTGVVGGAFLQLLARPEASALRLVGVANSRRQYAVASGLSGGDALSYLGQVAPGRDDDRLLGVLRESGAGRAVIVDATASADVARRHAVWLSEGFDVVTANKAANGGSLGEWRALLEACRQSGARYGDAATVGAGLPVIDSLRRLRACGDRLHAIEGVFSGSLSWLFNRFDGTQPFSALLREARELGFAEPDPREDLSGQDVARKLLILARTAGFELDAAAVGVENLVPVSLRALSVDAFLERAAALDGPMSERLLQARARNRVLRYLARFEAGGRATVSLAAVPASHPAASLAGTDNQFALFTDCYAQQPLVIQGPGAGAEVTAQALLGDLLALP